LGLHSRRLRRHQRRELVNIMTDEERARILREARETLRRSPAPYSPPPRMIGDDVEPEPEFVPEPAAERGLDTADALTAWKWMPADCWTGFELWLQTRLAAALAVQRQEQREELVENYCYCHRRRACSRRRRNGAPSSGAAI
jgi:hypothetical protein